MQHLFSILALSVAAVSGTQAPEALVLAFGDAHLPHNFKPSAISDHVIQRILGLRMESEVSLTSGEPDQETIEMLNSLGGSPAPLFGPSSEGDDISRNLLVLEGVDPEIVSFTQNEFQQNLLARVSSDSLLSHLFPSPLTEGDGVYNTRTRHCALHIGNGAPSDMQQPGKQCIPDGSIFQKSDTLESELLSRTGMVESWVNERTSAAALKISLQSPNHYEDSTFTVELLRSVLRGLDALSSGDKLTTAVLLPQPNTQRGMMALKSRAVQKKDTLPKTTISTSGAMFESNPLHVAPVCYASNSSCSEMTRNCSGHGYCYKKSGSSDQNAPSDCYACKCQETTIRKDDGTIQKIKWGGSACQKRDISSPFFLVAGITILVLLATGAAIGMLYNVGQEQLPGVISAGVGTVRTQK
ncbi:hypothetical protein P170DRAFT_390929 [Aspergillus steynii IBT 23096]|uniref:Vacuolar sorting protein Vps3844 C-terminal domain-containing protein n=1 Tax=Aspergillus steynii IBT 23096 TaxID=1392250 RepID=A0A2I2FVM5_9EURO|nr:uncharacterized protein P170DRAFT_390929 [Aspergillus steynii IBT 23096]PLB44681.1 hypothetical protein P170DRAFT_390929 [Aspergillus steynii IBT 23096]